MIAASQRKVVVFRQQKRRDIPGFTAELKMSQPAFKNFLAPEIPGIRFNEWFS